LGGGVKLDPENSALIVPSPAPTAFALIIFDILLLNHDFVSVL